MRYLILGLIVFSFGALESLEAQRGGGSSAGMTQHQEAKGSRKNNEVRKERDDAAREAVIENNPAAGFSGSAVSVEVMNNALLEILADRQEEQCTQRQRASRSKAQIDTNIFLSGLMASIGHPAHDHDFMEAGDALRSQLEAEGINMDSLKEAFLAWANSTPLAERLVVVQVEGTGVLKLVDTVAIDSDNPKVSANAEVEVTGGQSALIEAVSTMIARIYLTGLLEQAGFTDAQIDDFFERNCHRSITG
ncbi:MAG: hypothetical protein EA369_04340 [Bradymonadales bacterium]|nr:MAG: hypothetical protein EA369_04340 [Bradymonadales bacterium]